VDAALGAGAGVIVKVPVPVFVTVPVVYENTDAGITSEVMFCVKSLTRTCEVHPVLVPRESVTSTGDEKIVVNVEGKLTEEPRLVAEGAVIVRPLIGGTLLVTVMVIAVVAASEVETVPTSGVAIMTIRVNTF